LGAGFRALFGAPYPDDPIARGRPAIIARLLATGRPDLILVQYTAGHSPHEEWVYNGADLENAPVLWARDLGPEKNRRLIEYYAGRDVWRLYADEQPPRLEPYSGY
jgi:hypothetical protein